MALRDGDVTDQEVYSLVVDEFDNLKSKLNALSMRNLRASISFFAEGIARLFEMFEIANFGDECGVEQAVLDEGFLVMERCLNLAGLDESAQRKLHKAKKSFEDARKEATEAFHDAGLQTSHRVLAMKCRVISTLLETIDHPADALPPCGVCVMELNSLPAVQKNFDVQLKTGFGAVRGFFRKEQRREIISGVCRVNRAFFDVTRAYGEDAHFWSWPLVDIGNDKISPLYDARVTKVLRQQGMEHCCVTPWSFGQEGEEGHKLKDPKGIVTNSSGEFIVGGYKDHCVKVFGSDGVFLKDISLPTDEVNTLLYTEDIATNRENNIFLLTKDLWGCWLVYILTETADLHHTFLLMGMKYSTKYRGLSVRETGKVVTMRDGRAVEEYDSNGELVYTYGEGILKSAKDFTVANDGCVLVLDSDEDSLLCVCNKDFFVHIFSEHGEHLNKFKLRRNDYAYSYITFQPARELVIVAGIGPERRIQVEIYRKDGEFARSVQLQNCDDYIELKGLAVNDDGRIAVLTKNLRNCKIVVL